MTLFRVVGTILVYKRYSDTIRFLITKRSPHKKVFPGLWTVPGGGLEREDFINNPPSYQPNQWYDVLTGALRRELKEETGLTCGSLIPIIDLVFLQPDKTPVLTLSYTAVYLSGNVKLSEEDVDYMWVNVEEAGKMDLIPGIHTEIKMANNILTGPIPTSLH